MTDPDPLEQAIEHATLVQQWEFAERIMRAVRPLIEQARREERKRFWPLVNEIEGMWAMDEWGLRDVIGHTNYNAVMNKLDGIKAAIRKEEVGP